MAVLFRLPFLEEGVIPSHKKIMTLISPAENPMSAMIKWDESLPFPIDWPKSISQRLSEYIPPRARDVMLRVHCRTLQTASRMHSDLIPLNCLNCKRPRPTSPRLSPLEDPRSHGPLIDPSIGLMQGDPVLNPPLRALILTSEETLAHCLLTCPKVSPVMESLKRILSKHFTSHVDYTSELLFALPALPGDGFPFALIQALSFYHIWLARCEKRFQNRSLHPRAILQLILSAFVSACEDHFVQLRSSRSKKKKQLLVKHKKIASKHRILLFSGSSFPTLHPQFKRHWLLCQNFHPP